jgi:3-oxoadipate CoA-transferase beta subunit
LRKVVERCTYPLTGIRCVRRIYTDVATFDCTPAGLLLVDSVVGLERAELERLVGLPIAPRVPKSYVQ